MIQVVSKDELRELADDIKQNGLQSPIKVMCKKSGGGWPYHLLDGRNRLDAIESLGVDLIAAPRSKGHASRSRQGMECGLDIYLGLDDSQVDAAIEYEYFDDPFAYVISANIHRRHLTAEKKRDLIATLLKADPTKSNRQIAKLTNTSHPHVAKVRGEMEQAGDVETVTTSIDTKGREQPAKRKKAADTTKTEPT